MEINQTNKALTDLMREWSADPVLYRAANKFTALLETIAESGLSREANESIERFATFKAASLGLLDRPADARDQTVVLIRDGTCDVTTTANPYVRSVLIEKVRSCTAQYLLSQFPEQGSKILGDPLTRS